MKKKHIFFKEKNQFVKHLAICDASVSMRQKKTAHTHTFATAKRMRDWWVGCGLSHLMTRTWDIVDFNAHTHTHAHIFIYECYAIQNCVTKCCTFRTFAWYCPMCQWNTNINLLLYLCANYCILYDLLCGLPKKKIQPKAIMFTTNAALSYLSTGRKKN